MSYQLRITLEGERAITMLGHRYAWSAAFQEYGAGLHTLSESEAWEIAAAIEEDCEGGHDPLPCLNPRSDLYRALMNLRESIM